MFPRLAAGARCTPATVSLPGRRALPEAPRCLPLGCALRASCWVRGRSWGPRTGSLGWATTSGLLDSGLRCTPAPCPSVSRHPHPTPTFPVSALPAAAKSPRQKHSSAPPPHVPAGRTPAQEDAERETPPKVFSLGTAISGVPRPACPGSRPLCQGPGTFTDTRLQGQGARPLVGRTFLRGRVAQQLRPESVFTGGGVHEACCESPPAGNALPLGEWGWWGECKLRMRGGVPVKALNGACLPWETGSVRREKGTLPPPRVPGVSTAAPEPAARRGPAHSAPWSMKQVSRCSMQVLLLIG